MIDFKKSVSEQINQKSDSKKEKDKGRTLWHEIYNWYAEGGEVKINKEINSMLKSIKEKFKKEYEKIENEIESI